MVLESANGAKWPLILHGITTDTECSGAITLHPGETRTFVEHGTIRRDWPVGTSALVGNLTYGAGNASGVRTIHLKFAAPYRSVAHPAATKQLPLRGRGLSEKQLSSLGANGFGECERRICITPTVGSCRFFAHTHPTHLAQNDGGGGHVLLPLPMANCQLDCRSIPCRRIREISFTASSVPLPKWSLTPKRISIEK